MAIAKVSDYSIRFDFPSSVLAKNMGMMPSKVSAMIQMYATTKASQLEAKMKMNRPWTDRTGMAKTTLNASVSKPSDSKVRITLAHGVDYGIWLELAHNKNYAIIAPTIQQEGPKMLSELNGMLSKITL